MRKLRTQTAPIKIFAFFEDIILGYVTGRVTARYLSKLYKYTKNVISVLLIMHSSLETPIIHKLVYVILIRFTFMLD